MNFSKYFSKQARKPSGLFGFFYMSRLFDKGNAAINNLVKETLEIKENDRGLEIGFGTGVLLSALAGGIENGVMEGIDFSKSMFSKATIRNKKEIKSGKVKLTLGDFDTVEYQDNYYDKVFTVNTIYFWKKPDKTVLKIHRLLKPGGKIVIGFKDKSKMEQMPLNSDVFKFYSTDDVKNLLSKDKLFTNIEILTPQNKNDGWYCASATKGQKLQKTE